MPRVARIVVIDVAHHVTQRGNNRQDVFFVDEDRRAYLGMLAEECQRFGLLIRGYCLMDNHVHLVVVPKKKTSLARAIGRTHWRYAQYVNRLHGRSGHLWQNRFYSCPLDGAHTWRALIYAERNPVRAGMTARAWDYAWSSAAAHVGPPGGEDDGSLLDISAWPYTPQQWRGFLDGAEEEAARWQLRRCTSRGRPLGSDSFVCKLEKQAGRRLRPLAVGRPKKIPAKPAPGSGRPRARSP